MSAASPLLDFFRRGEAPHDVRMLAAQGVLAPRAHEQIALLVLLVDDRDAAVRDQAEATLRAIPEPALCAYLARTDVPIGMREFFGDRGLFPAEMPALTADAPLFDPEPVAEAAGDGAGAGDAAETLLQQLHKMPVADRMKAAMRGTREARAILIRDPNTMVAAAVLSSPKISDAEVESFARMATISDEILRAIALNRAWVKNYGVVVALTRNPKTPLGLSLNLLGRLNDRDMAILSNDRNIPDGLRTAARRKVVFGQR